MSARSEALAARVDEANAALRSAVEASTPEQWQSPCAEGEWKQGFAAWHASNSIANLTQIVLGMAKGEPREPRSFAEIDQMNAELHAAHAACTKDDALDLIERNAPKASAMVRRLSDDQLDRKLVLAKGMPEMSVEQVAQILLVGHPSGHLKAIMDAR